MKNLLVFLFLSASLANGQTAITFKSHSIGESAQQFFSTAKIAGKTGEVTSQLAADYCKTYLADPKVMKAYQKATQNSFDVNDQIKSVDVKGCLDIQDALAGKSANVGLRYAADVGKGNVEFQNGKLVMMSLISTVGYDDVVEDMKKKLGSDPQNQQRELQNAFGAKLTERSALWTTPDLRVLISESRNFTADNLPIIVITSSSYTETPKAPRSNSLD